MHCCRVACRFEESVYSAVEVVLNKSSCAEGERERESECGEFLAVMTQ